MTRDFPFPLSFYLFLFYSTMFFIRWLYHCIPSRHSPITDLISSFAHPDHWTPIILGHERIDLYLDDDIRFCALLCVFISHDSFLSPSHPSFLSRPSRV